MAISSILFPFCFLYFYSFFYGNTGKMSVNGNTEFYKIGVRAQSCQCQIPENFRFSEPNFLLVIEATIMLRKLNVFDLNYIKISKTVCFKTISFLYRRENKYLSENFKNVSVSTTITLSLKTIKKIGSKTFKFSGI